MILPILFLALISSALSQCPDQSSGLQAWSSLYASSDQTTDITIPAGTSVLYDTIATINTLTIDGTLVFSDSSDVALTAHWILVRSGGSLIIGSESCRYQHKANITLTGSRTTVSEMGSDANSIAYGTKGIAIANGATLELHGSLSTPSWTRLATTSQIGATTITLQDSVNWQVGDRIVIATTDFPAYYDVVPDQNEYRTITAVNGATVTLDSPLLCMHWSEGYARGEVGLLTRNILIQGSNEGTQFGGHLMVRKAASVHIEGVEFTNMGQRGIMGRYPIHFHMMGEVYDQGFYAKDNSIHHNNQRCIAIHNSHGLLLQDNVAFDTIGHCYFFEDGGERGNTLIHNLAILSREGSLIPSDAKPTNYWITNPNNTFIENVAVSAMFGFWFSLPDHPVDQSAAEYADSDTVWPSKTPLKKFLNNVAHSQDRNGLMVDEMLQPDGSTPLGGYEPRLPPYNTSGITGDPVLAVFEGTIAYKCRDHGVWTRASYIHVINTVVLDNSNGMLCVPGPSFIENAYIIGETNNIGYVTDYWGLEPYNRSRPVGYTSASPILGLGSYDAFYPQFYKNVTMENFVPNKLRQAGGLFALPNGIFILFPCNEYKDLKFVNANQVALESVWPNAYCEDCKLHDGPGGVNWLDIDGSVTGYVGGWIVSNNQFMINDNCVFVDSWNAYKCPAFKGGFLQLQVENLDTAGTDYRNSLSDWFRATWYDLENGRYFNITGGDPGDEIRTQYVANVRATKSYTLRFAHPTPSKLELSLGGAYNGGWTVIALPYPSGTTFTIVTGYMDTPMTPVNSLAELSKYTYYWDNSHLYIRLENWDNNELNEYMGFSWHNSWNVGVRVTASCSNCDVGGAIGANPSPSLPAPYVDSTDAYEVALIEGNCVGDQGHGFFSWDTTSHLLYYSIYHNVKEATVARISDSTGTVNLHLNSALSPIRGYLTLSQVKELQLWSGKLTVEVGTASNSAKISGTIGCVGSCSLPAKVPQGDLCKVSGSSIVLYSDDQLADGWSSWSWGKVQNANYKDGTDKTCGTSSISTQWDGGSALSMHNDDDVAIDPNVYTHFEFFARAESGAVDLYVSFNEDESEQVLTEEVINYVVEETWTRVRVPLSKFTITGAISRVTISPYWNAGDNTVHFDMIRFVTDTAVDTLGNPVSGTAVAYNEPECVRNPGGSSNVDEVSGAGALVGSLVVIATCLVSLML